MIIQIAPNEVTFEKRFWRFQTQVFGQPLAKQIYHFVGTLNELSQEVRDHYVQPTDGSELMIWIVDSIEA
jgi:hypothetical protein